MIVAGAKKQENSLVEIKNLEEDLQQRIRPFYLFHGENQWFTREAVKLLKGKLVAENNQDFSFEEGYADAHAAETLCL